MKSPFVASPTVVAVLSTAFALLVFSETLLASEFRDTDWSVRCWNAETKTWEDLGIEKMTVSREENGATRVTNSSGIHRHAHLVYPATPEGDFTFSIELRGGYELGFLHRAGKDEMLYVELQDKDGTPKSTEFDTYQLSRQGTRFSIRRNGRIVPLVHFRFDYGAPIVLTLAIKAGESAEIRSHSLESAGSTPGE